MCLKCIVSWSNFRVNCQKQQGNIHGIVQQGINHSTTTKEGILLKTKTN